MYNKLVNRLREPCQYENCVLCQEAADAIEGLSKHSWISVFDRLPADGISVLCWLCNDEGECYASVGWYDRKFRMWDLDSEYSMSRHVTHWMPLPIAPED